MTGEEVHRILFAKGVRHLHHANSVATSLSLLRLGGLASRELVEQHRLPQTDQQSDKIDKDYGIYGDVFVDTVDIHRRASNRNNYGPVLFVLSVDILLHLPLGSRVLVTKMNPTDWDTEQKDEDRYFLNANELARGIDIGSFGQMLVIRSPAKIIPFNGQLEKIILDEPRLPHPSVGLEHNQAKAALTNLLPNNQIPIERRICSPNCKCIANYTKSNEFLIRKFFRF